MKNLSSATKKNLEDLEDYYRRKKLLLICERMRKRTDKVQKRISVINVKLVILEAFRLYKFGYE